MKRTPIPLKTPEAEHPFVYFVLYTLGMFAGLFGHHFIAAWRLA